MTTDSIAYNMIRAFTEYLKFALLTLTVFVTFEVVSLYILHVLGIHNDLMLLTVIVLCVIITFVVDSKKLHYIKNMNKYRRLTKKLLLEKMLGKKIAEWNW